MKNEVKRLNTVYNAKGVVVGKTWGGSIAIYRSEDVFATSLKNLKKFIEEEVKSGDLDYGFGFEELIGAYMEIKVTQNILFEGRYYENNTYREYYTKGLNHETKLAMKRAFEDYYNTNVLYVY